MDQCEDGPGQFLKDFRYHVLFFPNETPRAAIAIAAKAGLIGLTMTIAKEFGSRGITCNAVAPGFIESDMTEALPQEFKDDVMKRAPAGRLGTPADIAPAVLFLASSDAAYVTGQTLTVDGGLFL
jgi:3-oxoacyl-[acyl-carrier protein] reductase